MNPISQAPDTAIANDAIYRELLEVRRVLNMLIDENISLATRIAELEDAPLEVPDGLE